MYGGTLYGNWEAIITLQQLVIIADDEGLIDMTPPAISAKTSIPLEIIEKGIKVLSEEDKYSRSSKEDGKRIVLIDPDRPWGWQIVNYKYYRDLASREDKKQKDRQRIAEKRKKNKDVAECRNESPDVADVAHTNTDTNTINNSSFEQFWNAYPRKENKRRAETAFKNLTKKDQNLAIKDSRERYKHTDKKFIPHATTYINGERWNDEKPKPRKQVVN